MNSKELKNKAKISTNAIEKLYISMRHLFNRGFYKPAGVSGQSIRKALNKLSPEIYGSMNDENKVELSGLMYVIDRLPEGIEECRYIRLIADEKLSISSKKPIIPKKRRRFCYRIDENHMYIEVTRGRSEIYDILTHLTFLYNEGRKILSNIWDKNAEEIAAPWKKIEEFALSDRILEQEEKEILLIHLSAIIGRDLEELLQVYTDFSTKNDPDRFIRFMYNLGNTALKDVAKRQNVEIHFSPTLREELGHHKHGEKWAKHIKEELNTQNLLHRPAHIISSNLHSVMNVLFASEVLKRKYKNDYDMYSGLSVSDNSKERKLVEDFALKNGMTIIKDQSGTNIEVQIFDLGVPFFQKKYKINSENAPVLIIMDYAFGEQAYETMDELLRPYTKKGKKTPLDYRSISIMGKAGILQGNKGDIMIPSAHIFEGTADNYPFQNQLSPEDFKGEGIDVSPQGTMLTVLGTSLQNKYLLQFFKDSTWNSIGLEMEGSHYQKAIQAAALIRQNVKKDIQIRYAYYASDNPLETGSTLSSGGLGLTGVKPTYLITKKIIEQILND